MKLRTIQRCIGIVGLSAMCALPLSAQMNGHGAAAQGVNNPEQNGMAGNMGPPRDEGFLKDAAAGNMAEVALGKLALEKSSNDAIKKFAQQMIDDHTAMEANVEAAAKGMSIKLPDSPDKGAKKELAKLQTMSGADFDKAYMAGTVKDHKKDLSSFKSEAGSTQNAGLKDLATNGAKTIQSHLEMAESLNQQLGGK